MGTELHIELEEIDRKIVLRLDGRLDKSTAPRLEKELDQRIQENHSHLLLDFLQVGYLSSAGLRILLAATKKQHAKQAHLILFNLNEPLTKIIHDAGFDKVFRLCKTEKDALQIN